MISNIPIYCDMDGVLVDFNGGISKILGREVTDVEGKFDWKELEVHQRLYRDLAPLPDALLLWDFLKRNFSTVRILTALPIKAHFPFAVEDKRAWVLERLPDIKDHDILFGPYSKDKQFHLPLNEQAILIDDNAKNIAQWSNRGGIAIIHFEVRYTIGALMKLLPVV